MEGGMIPAFKGLKGCHTEERLRLFRLAPGLSFEVFKQRKNDHLLSTWGMPSGVGSRGPPKSQLGCSLILMLPFDWALSQILEPTGGTGHLVGKGEDL